jgi:hypothetical protein
VDHLTPLLLGFLLDQLLGDPAQLLTLDSA